MIRARKDGRVPVYLDDIQQRTADQEEHLSNGSGGCSDYGR